MIGIFGGTFDPVHFGHLGLAKAAYHHLDLQRIIFVPLGIPPHRGMPQVSSHARVKMLQAALQPYPNFEISTVEVDKDSPSWTVKTLEYFARHLPDETLCLLMGSDAFKPINEWYQWRSLLDYGHLVVVSRSGVENELCDEVAEFLALNRVDSLPGLTSGHRGKILWLEAGVVDVSSTGVREAIEAGKALTRLLPKSVERLIRENRYYGYQ
jgi:nicotinate-nucleotide adenylyltransferase